MKSVRRFTTTLAATAALCLVTSTAPAQADYTWGWSTPKDGTAKTHR